MEQLLYELSCRKVEGVIGKYSANFRVQTDIIKQIGKLLLQSINQAGTDVKHRPIVQMRKKNAVVCVT